MRGGSLGLLTLLLTAGLALAQTAGTPQEPDAVIETCLAPAGLPQVDGTDGPDRMTSRADAAERIFGLGGDDVLAGAGREDCLFGGDGVDRLAAAPEGTLMYGEAGNDELLGGDGDDLLNGGPGNDVLSLRGGSYETASGGPGADEIIGGDGEDNLAGDAGKDELFGDRGNDILDAELAGDGSAERDPDVVRGGPGNDTLRGREGDRLLGEAGRDRIFARGSTRVDGGAGSDRIEVQARTPKIAAGSGNDRIEARDKAAERIDCGPGTDTVVADRSDTLVGCERVKLPPKPIAINLMATPASGARRTVFTVAFTAPYTLDGTDGSSFDVEGKGAGAACTSTQFSIFARKGRRMTVRLDPPRRGWCRGTLRIRLLDVFSDPSSNCDSGGECAESTSKVLAVRRVAIR